MNHYNNEIVSVNGTQHKHLSSDFLKSCSIGDDVKLIREPDNAHDKNAISVVCHDHPIGYIPRREAGARLAHILDSGRNYQAAISQVAPGNKHHIFRIKITTFPKSATSESIQRASPPPLSRPKAMPFYTQNHSVAIQAAKNQCGIYRIIGKNGKSYVGQSISIGRRWQKHIYELSAGFHSNSSLNNDWAKYGARFFRFEVLEECLPGILDEREKYHISQENSFISGYNATIDGQGILGYKERDDEYQPSLSIPDRTPEKGIQPAHSATMATTIKQDHMTYRTRRDGTDLLPGYHTNQSGGNTAPAEAISPSPSIDRTVVINSPEKAMLISLDTHLQYAYELKKRFPDAERIVTSPQFNQWLQDADPFIKDKSQSMIPNDGLFVLRSYKRYVESNSLSTGETVIEQTPVNELANHKRSLWGKVKTAVQKRFSANKS